jgi:hypothetical protein
MDKFKTFPFESGEGGAAQSTVYIWRQVTILPLFQSRFAPDT